MWSGKTQCYPSHPTAGPPLSGRTWGLAHERIKIARDHVLQLGVIRPSASTWPAPGRLPFTLSQRSPLETGGITGHSTELLSQIATWFHTSTTLPPRSMVHVSFTRSTWCGQIQVEPSDVPKTAIMTPFGLLQFIRMPFGLRNAARTF